VVLALGDVSGKGLPAALLMGVVHGAVRTASNAGGNWGELAVHLNSLLLARTSGERFVTLFWSSYDSQTCRLDYVNAGHLPPFLLRRMDGGTVGVTRLMDGGPVLGILPSASYQAGSIKLAPADLLVVYSDGIVEANNQAEEEFGEQRLLRILETGYKESASTLRDRIVGEVRRFAGEAGLGDDATLLIARVPEFEPAAPAGDGSAP
jgi:sigma-B regulation protein RsbU (phosphoserine phosphatase)